MDKQQIYQEIEAIIVKLFEVDANDITMNAKLYEDLELDSIDAVDLVVHLQKMTGEKINPEIFKSVHTVEDVVNAIDHLMQKKSN